MPILDDNPYLTQEDHYHENDDLFIARNEAIAAYESLDSKKSNLAKSARAVIRAIDRYLKQYNSILRTPILRDDLITPLRSVTVLLGGVPLDDQGSPMNNLTKSGAIQDCFDCANQFDKEFDGHPVAGALIAFIGATLCLASIALFCSSAGLLSPLSGAGIVLGSTLIASVVSGAGLTAGIGCTIGGLFMANRPNYISRALLNLNKEANRMQA